MGARSRSAKKANLKLRPSFQIFGYKHLSAGDLLREERSDPDSQYGELIESYIREGKIVPVDITCSLLEKAMHNSHCDKFLIDGFPRNKDNLEGWNRRVASNVKLLFVLYFNCSDEVCSKMNIFRNKKTLCNFTCY